MKKQEKKPEPKQEEVKQENSNVVEVLNWFQIIMLIGRPLWDSIQKKWRILNGYQSVLSNTSNTVFYEVTFTDTPHWENFADKKLFLNIPTSKEEEQGNGDKRSDKKGKRAKTENEK